jgi:hypothetical protein
VKRRLAHLAVADDVDSELGLLAHDLGDGLLQASGVGGLVQPRSARSRLDQLENVVRPRQAARMRREYPVAAALHRSAPSSLQ